jgi:hypothetical protein
MTDSEIRAALGRCLDLFRELRAIARKLYAQPEPPGYDAMLEDLAPYTLAGWLRRCAGALDKSGNLDARGNVDAFGAEIEELGEDLAEADRIAAGDVPRWRVVNLGGDNPSDYRYMVTRDDPPPDDQQGERWQEWAAGAFVVEAVALELAAMLNGEPPPSGTQHAAFMAAGMGAEAKGPGWKIHAEHVDLGLGWVGILDNKAKAQALLARMRARHYKAAKAADAAIRAWAQEGLEAEVKRDPLALAVVAAIRAQGTPKRGRVSKALELAEAYLA